MNIREITENDLQGLMELYTHLHDNPCLMHKIKDLPRSGRILCQIRTITL